MEQAKEIRYGCRFGGDLIAEDWELVTDEEKRLKRLLNSNFDEKDLTVSIHYAPDRTETQSGE